MKKQHRNNARTVGRVRDNQITSGLMVLCCEKEKKGGGSEEKVAITGFKGKFFKRIPHP